MCQKWFANFYARDFLLNNAPQSSRAADIDKNQIKTSLENN